LRGVCNDPVLANENRMSGPLNVVTFIRFGGIWLAAGLLQDLQARAKIDVIRLPIQHQGGNGFNAGSLSFSHPLLVLTEVNDFDIEARRIQCGGEVLFGGHADGTTGVIELGFGFHVRFGSFCFVVFAFAAARLEACVAG
jgi:hypothetical protein